MRIPIIACSFTISSTLSAVAHVGDFITSCLERYGCSALSTIFIKLALEEALVNAVKHGNKIERHKKVTVDYLLLEKTNGEKRLEFMTVITDEGEGFNPAAVPDPTLPENLAKPNGRGVFLIRNYMDRVCYNRRGNSVTLWKSFPATT